MKKQIFSIISGVFLLGAGMNSALAEKVNVVALSVEAAKNDGIKSSLKGISTAVQNSVAKMLSQMYQGQNHYLIDLSATNIFAESHICHAKVKVSQKQYMKSYEQALLGSNLEATAPVGIMTMKFCATSNHPTLKGKLIQLVFTDAGTVGGDLLLDLEHATCYTNVKSSGQAQQHTGGNTDNTPRVQSVSGIFDQNCYEELANLTDPTHSDFASIVDYD